MELAISLLALSLSIFTFIYNIYNKSEIRALKMGNKVKEIQYVRNGRVFIVINSYRSKVYLYDNKAVIKELQADRESTASVHIYMKDITKVVHK